MKKITAIIKPFKLGEMVVALEGVNVRGLTISVIKGFGRRRGRAELDRGVPHVADLLPKLYVEILLPKEKLEEALSAIEGSARTSRVDDGKIFVLPVERVTRI